MIHVREIQLTAPGKGHQNFSIHKKQKLHSKDDACFPVAFIIINETNSGTVASCRASSFHKLLMEKFVRKESLEHAATYESISIILLLLT